MTLGQGHDTPLGHGQQLCEISRSNSSEELWPGHTYFAMCALYLDLGGMTLGQGHDTSLGHGQQLCEILFRSNMAVRSYGPDTEFGYVCTVTLTLKVIMTLGQSHDIPLGHGQQLCEILSRSNMAVRSYVPDTDFGYVCTVTLTLEIWPWVKVMTHPWVMDNNCVKYCKTRIFSAQFILALLAHSFNRRFSYYIWCKGT